MHSLHHLGDISFQFTAQSSSSSINAWTRVPTMGPATPELYSAKASKVQRLLIGFRRSTRSRFPARMLLPERHRRLWYKCKLQSREIYSVVI